ncbi:hypothetical protein GDO81_023235 [Engystomops pustulosus]|uniref:Uncharacterized protein n=1 Tax=Engystomops pustulosus TaxID=76066 RepID=A0AAV6YMK0_ENGPU|nr:hypothetical protein GDO81_023235 [Engystomops pustulosus]
MYLQYMAHIAQLCMQLAPSSGYLKVLQGEILLTGIFTGDSLLQIAKLARPASKLLDFFYIFFLLFVYF